MPTKTKSKVDIELAMDRFRHSSEAENDIRTKSLDDVKFSFGDQWPPDLKSRRELKGKPCLVMDHLQQSILQVTNEQRQQDAAININPIGDDADVDTAEILQGIIRHIETISEADVARDMSFEQMVRGGFGYRRVRPHYPEDGADQQEIYIERIKNQFSVYFDPDCIKPDYSDARYCFIVEDVPNKEYVNEYKDSELATRMAAAGDTLTGIGNSLPEWTKAGTKRVAEYFYFESIPSEDETKPPKRKLKWAKINAIEVLEERDLPGKYIPVIPVLGHDADVDGKRYLAGLVRNAKDPQRMYNYFNSKATEVIALASMAPWIAAEGQMENHLSEWENANSGEIAVLQYKPKDVNGQPIGEPHRDTVEPPIQAMAYMCRQAGDDLKASIGLYDASLGQKGPEQSGKAILARQKQGDIATLNYSDNYARSIKYEAKVILDLIPHIYSGPQIMRIVKPDGSVEQVITHTGQPVGAMELQTESIKKIFDISSGRYDVAVSIGPKYQSKRQEAAAVQLELLKVLPPNIAPLILDIIVRNFDIPQSKEIADRLKKTIPPNILGGDPSDPQTTIQQLQAQVGQMQQQGQIMGEQLSQAVDIIKTKKVEQDAKIQVAQIGASIDKLKIDAQIAIAEIQTKAQSAQERAQMFTDIWTELHGSAHDLALQKDAQAHAQQLSAQQAAQQQGAQLQDQAHESDMATQGQAHEQTMAEQQAQQPQDSSSTGSV